jgi:hypothetical protein
LDSGRKFEREGGNVTHVLGLEFDEEHNGEVRFQISVFLKTLQAFTGSMLTGTKGAQCGPTSVPSICAVDPRICS